MADSWTPRNGGWLIKRSCLAALGLLLAACAAPSTSGPAQALLRDHTQCQAARYAAPQWSPGSGGEQIVYSSLTASSFDLRAMTGLGRDDHLLAQDLVAPLVSPDGSAVLFQRALTPGVTAFHTFLLDPASGQARQLSLSGQDFAWSPPGDGGWLAYVSTAQLTGSLFKLEVSTGQTVLLDRIPDGVSGWDAYPVWSSDGQRLAFAAFRDGRPSIQVIAAGGGVSTRLLGGGAPACLLPSPVEEFWPLGWRPDGRALLVQDLCDRRAALHLVDLAGHEIADLAALGPDATEAQLSPDGTQIVYTVDDPRLSHSGLFIARADGSNVIPLHADALDPHWSPDGRAIVFVGHDPGGLDEVDTIRPDGSALAQLTDNPGNGVCLH